MSYDSYYNGGMGRKVDWSYRGEYMERRHGVSSIKANDALNEPDAVTIHPDPASVSGQSTRVIGRARSTSRLLTVIVLDRNDVCYGVNGWPSNLADRHRYKTGGETR